MQVISTVLDRLAAFHSVSTPQEDGNHPLENKRIPHQNLTVVVCSFSETKHKIIKLRHEISNNVVCATSKASDHLRIRTV